jgi:CBS domain containing-hemolysin-like protein
MVLLISYLLLAIFISFLCSVLEAVLLSVTPSYIESLRTEGKVQLQKRLAHLKQDIDKPLAAILSFNTIAHTVGAAGVGAQAAAIFGDQYIGIISAVLTLLILVFSEIIPKTIGANYWRSLVGFTARTLKVLMVMMYPLVLLAQGITKLLSSKKKEATVSRAEVFAMADLGEREGVFHTVESKMLKNRIRFRQIKAKDIMTPRTVIVTIQQDKNIQELFDMPEFEKVSRVPLFNANRDDITGYVHKVDVLTALAKDEHQTPLTQISRNILMVSEDMQLLQLLDKFLESKEHIALVNDHYGGVSGLVTMEDVMETVLGMEIIDEFDSVEDMQVLARDRWKKRAIALGIITKPTEKDSTSPKD